MPNIEKIKHCIIYCRVSSTKQAQQGESLEDQEIVGRRIAESFGFPILKVFKEQYTGRKENRPVIDEIFTYIKKNPKKVDVLIFRAIDRFTRNGTLGYETLKRDLLQHGVELIDGHGVIQPSKNTLEHLGVEYSWSKIFPSEITELVLAQQGKNEVSQILTRMIGAEINLVRDGYHVGPPNEGYINTKIFVEGKKKNIQVPDPKYALYFIKMFELRALGTLTDQEITDQINALGYKSRVQNRWSHAKDKIIGSKGGTKLTVKYLQKAIANPIYCGVVRHKWLVKPIKTKYPGLVSISTFNMANKGKVFIEEKKDGSITIHENYNPHSLKRLRDNPLFPFKSVILCPLCEKPFKGSIAKGKSGKGFPTYHCSRNHKHLGVNKKEFEKSVAHFINNLKNKEGFFEHFEATLINKYKEKEKELETFSIKSNNTIAELEAKKLQKIEAFTCTKNEVIRSELERQIQLLQEEIVRTKEQQDKLEVKEADIRAFVNYTKYLMEHREEMLIKQKNFSLLRALFGLVFDKIPTYPEVLSGTPKLSLVYRLSEKYAGGKSLSVSCQRFEWNTLAKMVLKWNFIFINLDLTKHTEAIKIL